VVGKVVGNLVGVVLPFVLPTLRYLFSRISYRDYSDVLAQFGRGKELGNAIKPQVPPLAPTEGPGRGGHGEAAGTAAKDFAPSLVVPTSTARIKEQEKYRASRGWSGASDWAIELFLKERVDKGISIWAEDREAAATGGAPSPEISARTIGDKPPEPEVDLVKPLQQVLGGLLGFDPQLMQEPRVLLDRNGLVVLEDEEFGRQMLGGFNPVTISALKEMPSQLQPPSAITEQHIQGDLGTLKLKDLVAAAVAGGRPRLYLVDYWEPLASFFKEDKSGNRNGGVLHAGRALLFLQQDKHEQTYALVPIAIELAASQGDGSEAEPVVYSRSQLCTNESDSQSIIWELAKLVFRSLDVAVHQTVSHFLRTHATMEPIYIALCRNISTMHPLYKLMKPHFRYTLAINAAARAKLINEGGIIENTFAAGEFAMRATSLAYKKWSFVKQALPADLEERGMVGGKDVLGFDYPYATDGLELWRLMEDYVKEYVALYYENDEDVMGDRELQDWWREVVTEAHADVPDKEKCWGPLLPVGDSPGIKSRKGLVMALVTVMWIGSALHAAVNFGQYDYTSLPLNAPSLIRRPMPKNDEDKAWKELVAAQADVVAKVGKGDDHRRAVNHKESLIMRYLSDPFSTLIVATIVKLLSTHAEDEQYLTSPNLLITDPKAKEANMKFIEKLKELEEKIDQVHRQGSWVRGFPRGPVGTGSTYGTTLIPSGSPGTTMRGVPYSVSI